MDDIEKVILEKYEELFVEVLKSIKKSRKSENFSSVVSLGSLGVTILSSMDRLGGISHLDRADPESDFEDDEDSESDQLGGFLTQKNCFKILVIGGLQYGSSYSRFYRKRIKYRV